MDELNISTTGLNVTLDDLGVTFTHPETRNLLDEAGWTDIIDSLELEQAIKSGALTATDENGDPVLSSSIGGIYKEIQNAGSSEIFNNTLATGSVNGDGTTNSIVGASAARLGVGTYRITFDSPLSDANYPVIATTGENGGTDDYMLEYRNVTTASFDIFISEQDNGTTAGILVDSPFSFFIPSTSGAFIGLTDHDELQGLGDDDHPQYALTDGSRGNFATTAQGSLADTAVQPGDLATVATTGNYSDLIGLPSFALVATTGDYNDLLNLPTIPPAAPVDSVNGQTGVVVITASDVGLGNVDNTSDLNKPISTATQTALDGKVDDAQVLTNVPAGAVFTDTVYDDTDVQNDIATLEAQDIAFNAQQTAQDGLIATNTAKVSADGSIDTHSDVDVTTNPPNVNEVLGWDGSNFVPQVVAGGSSPWDTVTGGINFDGGFVGVDADAPLHNIQVGQQFNDTQVNPARVQDTEIAQYAGTANNNGTATLGLYESVPSTEAGAYGARIRYEADVNLLRFTTVQAGVETEAFNWDRATQVASFFGDINGQVNQAKNFADATDDQDLMTLNQFRLLTDTVKVRSSATGNLNTGVTTFNNFTTTDELGSTLGQFTFATNGVTPLFTGQVRIDFNIELIGSAARATIGFRWSHNGSVGAWVRHTYIRNASGHTESSANFSTVINVVAGQPIQIEHDNFAGGGTVTSPANGVEFTIQRTR